MLSPQQVQANQVLGFGHKIQRMLVILQQHAILLAWGQAQVKVIVSVARRGVIHRGWGEGLGVPLLAMQFVPISAILSSPGKGVIADKLIVISIDVGWFRHRASLAALRLPPEAHRVLDRFQGRRIVGKHEMIEAKGTALEAWSVPQSEHDVEDLLQLASEFIVCEIDAGLLFVPPGVPMQVQHAFPFFWVVVNARRDAHRGADIALPSIGFHDPPMVTVVLAEVSHDPQYPAQEHGLG